MKDKIVEAIIMAICLVFVIKTLSFAVKYRVHEQIENRVKAECLNE